MKCTCAFWVNHFSPPMHKRVPTVCKQYSCTWATIMKYTSFMCSAISINRVVSYVIIYHLYFSFPAPDGTPQSFTVSAGARNVTFSWSPPAPTLRNGIITSYSLSCVPEGDGEALFPCSTQRQVPSHWRGLHQPPHTTAPFLPATVREVDQWPM